MAPKRPLGIGKALKQKKQKVEDASSEAPAAPTELAVELSSTADADDELDQLRALWLTFVNAGDNELVLNGVVHECDRLLRNDPGSAPLLGDDFHAIYALALSRLASFTEQKEAVRDYFEAALERISLGLDRFPKSSKLLFAKAAIILSRIPLEFVSQMDSETRVSKKFPKMATLVDEALVAYSEAESLAEVADFDAQTFDILEALDDLLDLCENFGSDRLAEGMDSDCESEDEVDLPENHPLWSIKEANYSKWWKTHLLTFLSKLEEKASIEEVQLKRDVQKKLGQSYLVEAELPASIYTSFAYGGDEDEGDADEGAKATALEAAKSAKKLIKTALKYLSKSEDPEDPQSLVDIAEAKISLGNLYALESEEQERYYKEAETLLRVANKATHGKYDNILENLLGNE